MAYAGIVLPQEVIFVTDVKIEVFKHTRVKKYKGERYEDNCNIK